MKFKLNGPGLLFGIAFFCTSLALLGATNRWGAYVPSVPFGPQDTNPYTAGGSSISGTNPAFWGTITVNGAIVGSTNEDGYIQLGPADGTTNIALNGANGRITATYFLGDFRFPTNAANTGVFTWGKSWITNLTGNITLGLFGAPDGTNEQAMTITAIPDGSTRTVTIPAGVGSIGGTRTFYCTNGTIRRFYVDFEGGYTNITSVTYY